jgi:hypothetical protein
MEITWANITEGDTSCEDYFWSTMEKYGHVKPVGKNPPPTENPWRGVVGMSSWRSGLKPDPKTKSNNRKKRNNKK